jgi:para-aminobenzoate synthetase component 1
LPQLATERCTCKSQGMSTDTQTFEASTDPQVSTHEETDLLKEDILNVEARTLPDLGAIFERETHASLLFDDHPNGKCLLAVGARRSFTWSGEGAESLDGWNAFLKPEGKATWAFGWLGYDLKNGIEKLESQRLDHAQFPTLHWVEPRVVIEWGGNHSNAHIVHGADEDDAQELLQHVLTPVSSIPDAPGISLKPRWDEATYLQRARRVKKHIQRGDVYELNLCQEWMSNDPLESVWDAFVRLQHFTQSPYSALVKAGEFHLISGSPELFLDKRGSTLTSSPIKGTIARGATNEEDQELARKLHADPKERGENVMICDLVRNDLSRIAQPGTVHVPELFGIHRFRSVHQMISTVQCEVRPECDPADILRASFPMGSMTGAPKVRAMELIDELEGCKRGVYSGSVGYFQPSGDFSLNVVIRSLLYNANSKRISMHVGGAITSLSIPEKEYEECLLKAEAMLKTLRKDA